MCDVQQRSSELQSELVVKEVMWPGNKCAMCNKEVRSFKVNSLLRKCCVDKG